MSYLPKFSGELDFPEHLKTLAEGYAIQLRHETRVWIFAAMLSFLCFAGTAEQVEVKELTTDKATNVSTVKTVEIVERYSFLGAKLGQVAFPVAGIAALLATFFVFTVATCQAQRAGELFRAALTRTTLKNEDDRDWLRAVAHVLYPSSVNRVYPLTHAKFLPVASSNVELGLKMVVCFVYYVVPLAGVFRLIAALPVGSQCPAAVVTLVLLVPWIAVLLIADYRWAAHNAQQTNKESRAGSAKPDEDLKKKGNPDR